MDKIKIFKSRLKFLLLIPVYFFSIFTASSQQVIDQVAAVVGTKIILKSDIEKQYIQFLAQGGEEDIESHCLIFEELLLQKLLLNQAEIDSVTVSDSQVESELDRRMRFYIRQIGSQEKLEEYFHTTIRELKADFRDLIEEQLIVQTMQSKITKDITSSPNDVRTFFEKIPPDSVPYIDAELEIAQIVKIPPVNPEEKKAVRLRLEEFRNKIVSKETSFEVIAALYSEDPSSAKKGGELGFFDRGTMLPEFEAVAFNLNPGEISPIIETKFGFHILQLIERRGDQVNVRHILFQPKINDEDLIKAVNTLDSIRTQIVQGTVTFETAAEKFSDDADTKNNGGLMINPETNTTKLSPDKIDRVLFFQVDTMNLNTVSKPLQMTTPEGKTAYRLVMLKSRTQPHKANLKDDYQRIQEIALAEKQNNALSDWVKKRQQSTYVQINPGYENCDQLKQWKKNN